MQNWKRNPVAMAIKVLALLVESELTEVGIRELAAAPKISQSKAYRILLSSADEGLMQRGATAA